MNELFRWLPRDNRRLGRNAKLALPYLAGEAKLSVVGGDGLHLDPLYCFLCGHNYI